MMSTDYRTSIFDEPSPFDIILFSVGGFTGPNCVGMTSNQYKRIWLVNTVSYQTKKKYLSYCTFGMQVFLTYGEC